MLPDVAVNLQHRQFGENLTRGKSAPLDKLVSLKEELFALRFQLAINQLDNTARLKAVKKDIARIKTTLRQSELAEQ